MKDNLLSCFSATMKWEGGEKLSMNPRDPGNYTGGKVGVGQLKGSKYGVSAAAHPNLDIAALSLDDAAQIFKREYWDAVGGDILPLGLDHCVSDDAYNAGPGNARRLYAKVQGIKLPSDQIAAFSAARLSFLRSLKTWSTFSRGWSTRVAGVEAESLRMAGAPPETVQGHANAAQARSSNHAKAAGGAATGTVVSGAATGTHIDFGIFALLTVIALVAAVVLFWKSQAQAARAEALLKLATELKK